VAVVAGVLVVLATVAILTLQRWGGREGGREEGCSRTKGWGSRTQNESIPMQF